MGDSISTSSDGGPADATTSTGDVSVADAANDASVDSSDVAAASDATVDADVGAPVPCVSSLTYLNGQLHCAGYACSGQCCVSSETCVTDGVCDGGGPLLWCTDDGSCTPSYCCVNTKITLDQTQCPRKATLGSTTSSTCVVNGCSSGTTQLCAGNGLPCPIGQSCQRVVLDDDPSFELAMCAPE